MGTRHLIAIVLDKKIKVAQYGQWDGYPSGNGRALAKAIVNIIRTAQLQDFITRVRKCSFATQEQLEEEQRKVDAGQPFPKQFSRDTSAEIVGMILDSPGGLLLKDSSEFARDSLFCEWAYVIDLDTSSFEIYKGFQTEPHDQGRFSNLEPNLEPAGYYPVKLIKTINIFDLEKHLTYGNIWNS